MQFFLKKRIFKVLIIASFLLAIIFINPQNFFTPLQRALIFIFAPFEKVSYTAAFTVEQSREFLNSIGNLKNENSQLLKQNQDLLAENAKLQSVGNENELLRQQLELLPRNQYSLISAFIISQDPQGLGNWLEIDRGSDDGIVKGDSVIVSKGILVGRIDEVSAKTAKVVLLTNPQSTINVATLKNNTKGVAKGEYGLGIIFDMILQTDVISAGDEVVTSGIGGDIPKGLYVGKVQEVHPSEDHLFQQAVITSPVQISQLQVLSVIKDSAQ